MSRGRWLALVVLPLLLSARAAAGDVLARVDLIRPEDAARLAGLPVRAIARAPEGVLVVAGPEGLRLLEAAGLAPRVLDREAWSLPYYLAMPVPTASGEPPSGVEVLGRWGGAYLVKVEDTRAEEVGRQGFRLARLHREGCALLEAAAARRAPAGLRGGERALQEVGPIGQVVSQVSDSLLAATLTRLQAFQTRYSFSDSVHAAAQWLAMQFDQYGYADVSFDTFYVYGNRQRNVAAVKTGTLDPSKVVVVGGHYDSVVYDSCDPQVWAPGVDDNGSGTAVTLEVARILAGLSLDKTVRFVPFAAEEQGLWGSDHYAREARARGDDIVLMVNMDMVANLEDSYWDVGINTSPASRGFAEVMADMALAYTDLIPFITASPSSGSDSWSFFEQGYRFVYAEEGDFSPNWHRCSDTIDNVSVPYLTQVTEMVLATALFAANAPAAPEGVDLRNLGDGGTLVLTWRPVAEADVVGYKVYLGTASGAYDSTWTVADTSATLTGLEEGTPVFCAVSAVDGDGFEGMLSAEMSEIPSVRPDAPQGLDATSWPDRVSLRWEANNAELDLGGYRIYRRAAEEPMALLDEVPAGQRSYDDASLDPDSLYRYAVAAVDTQTPPQESPLSGEVRGRLATHEREILIVDATRDGSGAPLSPTDEQVDAFYARLLQGYPVRGDWDLADSLAAGLLLSDADLALYWTVVWHADDRSGPDLAPDTSAIRKYLAAGGHLWLGGWALLPNIGGYSGGRRTFAPGSFVSDWMRIDSSLTTQPGVQDFVGARPLVAGYPPLAIDAAKVPIAGLFNMDLFLPPLGEGAESIYGYVARDTTVAHHGLPNAHRWLSAGPVYSLVLTDFPAYYLEEASARMMLRTALADLGMSPVAVGSEEVPDHSLPRALWLGANYPNPFNPSTTIPYAIPAAPEGGGARPVRLLVHNLRGQVVRRLVEEPLPPGRYMVHWDGRGEGREPLPSGAYLARLEMGGRGVVRKVLLLR